MARSSLPNPDYIGIDYYNVSSIKMIVCVIIMLISPEKLVLNNF